VEYLQTGYYDHDTGLQKVLTRKIKKESKRKRVTIVVFDQDKRVLLVKDKGIHKYSLPGGGIHRHETTKHAASRELYEELKMKAIKNTRRKDCDIKTKHTNHKVCVIESYDYPKIHDRELRKFIWWDCKTKIKRFDHVDRILVRLYESKNIFHKILKLIGFY